MRKFFILLILIFVGNIFGQVKIFYQPQWQYYQVKNVKVIFDTQFQERARLIASFLNYILEEYPELENEITTEKIIIDANYISDNLNFDFYHFVENSFQEDYKAKLDYDPISFNNLNKLKDIPLSFNLNSFKKDFLQYSYNLTHGKTLQGTKDILYPDWFKNPIQERNLDFLSAFERKIQIKVLDNYRDFALNNQRFTVNQLLNDSFLRKQPSKLYLNLLAQDYFMRRFGTEAWEKIVEDVEYFDTILFTYSRAFKKHTGLTLSEFYRDTHEYYQAKFLTSISNHPPDVSKPLLAKKAPGKNPSFISPHFLSDNDVVALYSSYDDTPALVRINSKGIYKKIHEVGYTVSDKISVNDPYVLWAQNFYYPSFHNFDYSRIAVYNLESKDLFYIGDKNVYIEPSLSPDQQTLALLSYNQELEQQIKVVDFPTGSEIITLPNTNSMIYSDIKWLNNKEIVFIGMNFLGQSAIYNYNLEHQLENQLTPLSLDPISDLAVYNETIFFTYPVNDVLNICFINPTDSLVYQVFHAEVSANHPSIYHDKIIFSSNRYWGDELRTITIDEEFIRPLEWAKSDDLLAECMDILNLHNGFDMKKYQLSPFYQLIEFKKLRFSYDQNKFFLYSISQNPTNTFTLHAKSSYNISNKGIKTTLSNVISKHYPNILTEISHANANFSRDKFEEITFGSSIKLPYYFVNGFFKGYLNLNVGLYHLDRYKSRNLFNFLENANFSTNYLRSDLSLSYTKIRAKNHFYSPLGQNYLLSYKKSIDDSNVSQFYLVADYSCKGFRKSDSFLLENSFMWENQNNNYTFPSQLSYVYGYNQFPPLDRIYKSTLKYYLPLFYPEKGIDNVLFLKRIYTSLFASYTKAILNSTDNNQVRELNSIGNEFIFDFNIMDSFEFGLGIRYSHTFNQKSKHQLDIFIPLSKF